MVLLVLKAQRALRVPLVLLAWQDLLDLQDLRVALDLQEFEANRVTQDFQVLKEKLDPKGNRGHMVFKVQLAHLVKKAKGVPEVIQEQLVLQAQWEKGVLLAIVVFQALMVYLDQRELKERGVL